MTATPDLTLVLTGRNDNYGGDFSSRFFRALRFNHALLASRDVAYDLVFVEWDPVPAQPALADLVREAVPEVRDRLTTYVVDPAYQDACCLNPALAYLEYVAKNLGIRRAAGRFVLATNTDIYLSPGVVDRLAAGQVEPGVVYRANRIDVKLGADESHISQDLLDDPRNHVPRPPIAPPLYAGATGDFVLLDRQSWTRLRGFNEVYRLARIGLDHNFLVKAFSSGCRIADLGAPVYHVAHLGSYQVSKSLVRGEAAEALWGNQQWHSHDVVYENPDTWGLADAPTVARGPQSSRVVFDWHAVPPLVDLRRVVLPVSRLGQADRPI